MFNTIAGFYPVFEDAAKVLNCYDKTKRIIEGYTDSVRDENYHKQLSMQGANSVANY
jgi:outer membrane protein OmpA-like peptidoglycan-associated protein